MQPLGRSFYARSPETVARELLGCFLVYEHPDGIRIGKIVETESYAQDDPSAHSFKGQTPRNAAMFGEPGTLYAYLIYGMHLCINVVTSAPGTGDAVLIRAIEPVKGLAGKTDGPALLTKAFGITLEDNKRELTQPPLYISAPEIPETASIVTTTRVGIRLAADAPRRYYLEGNPFVSRR